MQGHAAHIPEFEKLQHKQTIKGKFRLHFGPFYFDFLFIDVSSSLIQKANAQSENSEKSPRKMTFIDEEEEGKKEKPLPPF